MREKIMPKRLVGNRCGSFRSNLLCAVAVLLFAILPASAQQAELPDAEEPAAGRPQPKLLAAPVGGVRRPAVDEKSMRALIGKLVACGTRLTLSSWTDAQRGIACGRDVIVARFHEIAKDSGGKLQVAVDK